MDNNNKLQRAFAPSVSDLAFDDLRRAAALHSEETDFVIPRNYIVSQERFQGMEPIIEQLITTGRQRKNP